MKRKLLLLAMFLSIVLPPFATNLRAQSNDSSGKDFWVAFMSNYATSVTLALYITGDTDTTGTVTIPGQASPVPFTVTAGAVTTVTLPDPSTSQILTPDTVANLGVHIVAEANVTVYGLNYIQASTDAFLGLPTSALGKEYLVMAFPATISVLGSELAIVGTENSTTVTITPSVTAGSHAAHTPYSITLNQGQTYELQATGANADLTGTTIVADKAVAVYGGNACADVPSSTYGACNHLVEELPPTNAWGKSFFTEPLATRHNGDTFRILASTDNTTVTKNGATLTTLNAGEVYQTIIDGSSQITADHPVLITQLSNGTSYDHVSSDPFMMLVSPYEQYLTSYVITTPATGFAPNYVNVISPTAGISGIKVDGVAVDSSLFAQIGTSNYSGAQIPIAVGSHKLEGTLPFGVITYGYASADGYGYIGGYSLSPVASVASVALSPVASTVAVGGQACVNATVKDSNNNGLSGIRVDFAVTGANTASGQATTSANGAAQYCYSGANSGTDTVTGSVSGVSGSTSINWGSVITLALSPETLPDATYDAAYSQTISASGGSAPYSFSVTSGSLPAGLSLSSAGVLSGSPTGVGSSSFTVTATDSNSATGSASFSLAVTKATPNVTTWPTASSITYGQALSASTLSGGAASVAGSFAWTAPTTTPAIGASSQSVTFTPSDADHYFSVTGDASVTVAKVTPTVSAWPTASSLEYGQPLSSSTLSGGEASVAGSFAWTSPTTVPPGGASSQSVTFTPTAAETYNSVVGSSSITVSKAASAIALSVTPSSAMAQQNVTLTAVVSAVGGAPTGSVAFHDGDTLLGTVVLNAGSASFSTASLSAGDHSLTAVYAGDDNHLASQSSAVAIKIIDLTLSVVGSGGSGSGSGSGGSGGSGGALPSGSVTPGGSTSVQVTITSSQSLTLPVSTDLTVEGLPVGATATVPSNNWVQTAGMAWQYPANVALVNPSLVFNVPKTVASRGSDHRGLAALLSIPALFGLLLPFGFMKRLRGRARRSAVALALLALGAAALMLTSGCGSANGYFSQPEKTYTVTITVTAGSISKVSHMTLYVQ